MKKFSVFSFQGRLSLARKGFFRGLGEWEGVEAEFASGLGGRTDELADGIEDGAELAVVFVLHFADFLGKVAVGVHEAAELDEGPHDSDVHLYGAL